MKNGWYEPRRHRQILPSALTGIAITLEYAVAEQEKLFLTELRLCGESDHWRVDVRYTAELARAEGDPRDSGQRDSSQNGGADDDSKSAPAPESVTLSMLLPAGDRSIVDLQIAAMDRAVALLQATAEAARAEQRQVRQPGSGSGQA